VFGHYLGQEIDVFDAKLHGIAEATEVATRLAKDEETTDVWIVYNNQVVG
jgi:hypothetical protein